MTFMERTQVVLWATIAGAVINAIVDYLLIFGEFGFPRLELVGAGIASVFSATSTFLFLLAYALWHPKLRRYNILGRIWRSDWPVFFQILRIGTPIGLTIVAEGSLFTASAIMASRYHEVYQDWKDNPLGFWKAAASEIDWVSTTDTVFDPDHGQYGRWFPDWECNTCYNCLDRHVERGRPGQPALIYDSPITGKTATYSFAELLAEVEAMAAVFSDQGLEKGDRAIIYMMRLKSVDLPAPDGPTTATVSPGETFSVRS